MATPASDAPTPSARYALQRKAELPIARLVALALVLVPIAAWILVSKVVTTDPSPEAQSAVAFNPRSLLTDNSPHFLPTPVAALPAETNAGPPAPSAGEQTASDAAPVEHVKVANTGGAGAVLRVSPPLGAWLTTLRDGAILQVIERRQLTDGSEWLHVQTADGTEGWIFGRLVAAAD